MSINDLVKEEAQRQIDHAVEEIPVNISAFSTPIAKARLLYENINDFGNTRLASRNPTSYTKGS